MSSPGETWGYWKDNGVSEAEEIGQSWRTGRQSRNSLQSADGRVAVAGVSSKMFGIICTDILWACGNSSHWDIFRSSLTLDY